MIDLIWALVIWLAVFNHNLFIAKIIILEADLPRTRLASGNHCTWNYQTIDST